MVVQIEIVATLCYCERCLMSDMHDLALQRCTSADDHWAHTWAHVPALMIWFETLNHVEFTTFEFIEE